MALAALGCAHAGDTHNLAEGSWRLSSELLAHQLAPRVLVITHEQPYPANMVVVETRDRTLVLVGSPYTPEATRTVLTWLEDRFGERKRIAIDTHFHEDAGVGGNAVYREAGISIYGSEATVRLLAQRNPQAAPPDHVFPLDAGIDLDFGEPVHVRFPGPGHTVDNVVVHFPAERLLVAGCLLKGSDSIGNVADADLARWPTSVRSLERYDVDWMVPGHGDRFDRGLIANTIAVVRGASK
jgi:glyoxylase-like metal-dependent hydrolase (beta-lactamase superfamily II)